MKCGYMINLGNRDNRFVPCGQCMPCRINKKREWAGKILLEARYQEKVSTFLTLTYNEDHMPDRGSLEPSHLSGFLNRLRARKAFASNNGLRYFAVGEYGNETWRPHYHLALFGIQPEYESEFQSAWTSEAGAIGHIHTGEITPQSASYIAGYTTKKMTSQEDPRLEDMGMLPEFARMSRFPPLGAKGMEVILDTLCRRDAAADLAERGDVPAQFKIYGKTWPLSKYWRNWLRNQLGIIDTPEYMPWIIDIDQFKEDCKNAQKKAQKLFRQKNNYTTKDRL